MSCWPARPFGGRQGSSARRRPLISAISWCTARSICWVMIMRPVTPMPSAWKRWSGGSSKGSGISANMRKAGHEMVVHDARRQAAEKICAAGAEWADSPKAVAQATEIVFTWLPGPREFEAVVRGDNGLLAGMQRGQPLFDLSTNSPTLMRSLEPLFAERGAVLFDSPVSGGPAGAASGKMAIWVGGDEEVFKRYRPVLDSAGDQVSYIGPIGS